VIYPRFSDGRSVDDAVQQVRAEAGAGKDLTLRCPFPSIEAVWWCPKLRDGEGRPLVDSNGEQRLGSSMLFTLDNRRLYVMQRAAVLQYPRHCVTRVNVVTEKSEVMKHLKKFRTRTNGLSITVSEWNGHGRDNARHFSAMRVWDWRSVISSIEWNSGERSDAVAAADLGSCGCWEYLDFQGVQRGPFSNWQMRQWWEENMLPEDLQIRPYDARVSVAEKGGAKCTDFRVLTEWFKDAPTVFAPGFSPRGGTDLDAKWKRCSRCGRSRWEGWPLGESWYCAACWHRWKSKHGAASS